MSQVKGPKRIKGIVKIARISDTFDVSFQIRFAGYGRANRGSRSHLGIFIPKRRIAIKSCTIILSNPQGRMQISWELPISQCESLGNMDQFLIKS